ncbi:unnamed protein product [Hermetia illucens]|uniref:Polyprenal reductase n=1 Tax=Hermetia illucens TaxID=343691 RepID=A0A7R8UKS5_HERIL|nr:polyprenol reductase [Hermetia illucens]CAD7082377.1 unnamed protein product [Hermetia illucens]
MWAINFLNFIFISFILVIVIFGALINFLEPYLPTIIKQSFRYGKMSYKGDQSRITSLLEIPKSWFKHFYVFSLIWSIAAVALAARCYLVSLQSAPTVVLWFLDIVTGSKERQVEVDSTTCLIAVVLIFLQCARRWYETHFIQIFSSKSKINLSHYLVGYFHYFASITGIIANAEGFVRGSNARPVKITDLNILGIVAVMLFLYSWLQQYLSNLTLVNLRKSKDGKVVTEDHLMPQGGWFEDVSSPHMLFEVLMYVALMLLMPYSVTMRYAALWVLSNQVETAWLTHKWYQQTFGSKYPKRRKAIFPKIL